MTTSDDLDALVEGMKAQGKRLEEFYAEAIKIALERDRLQSELTAMTARALAAEAALEAMRQEMVLMFPNYSLVINATFAGFIAARSKQP